MSTFAAGPTHDFLSDECTVCDALPPHTQYITQRPHHVIASAVRQSSPAQNTVISSIINFFVCTYNCMLYSIVLDCHGAKRLAKTYSPCSSVPNTCRRTAYSTSHNARTISILNESGAENLMLVQKCALSALYK